MFKYKILVAIKSMSGANYNLTVDLMSKVEFAEMEKSLNCMSMLLNELAGLRDDALITVQDISTEKSCLLNRRAIESIRFVDATVVYPEVA